MKQTPEVPALPYRSPLGFRLKLVDDQETALPMTPEREVEVRVMYARAEAAAAIVKAAVQYVNADDMFHPSHRTLHDAVTRYISLCNEAHSNAR